MTTEELGLITAKAAGCLRQGLIDVKSANKVMRAAKRLLIGLRKDLRGQVWDAEQRATDIAELREADLLLSRLLAADSGQIG